MDSQQLFARAFARRLSLFSDPHTDCFRLFNGAGDGLDGLCVDRYGAWLLVLLEKKEVLQRGRLLCASIEKAARGLPLNLRGILCKDITGRDTGCIDDVYASELVSGELPPGELVVQQNGILAGADLLAGRHTGLFLDMRQVRQKLAPLYRQGGSMLNLFCYSAVFSVHGLKNGLAEALNLDLAKTALALAQRNYRLNSLACRERDFMYGDALAWMRAFAKKGRRFDFIVLDPPTFSRGKKGLFSVKKDFPACLELAAQLAPGGRALTVINSPAFSERQYRAWHPQGWKLCFLEHESGDFPFPDKPYLKAGLWELPP
jgi:23S rRNA (cytosine1962-C5)-methyltransferase